MSREEQEVWEGVVTFIKSNALDKLGAKQLAENIRELASSVGKSIDIDRTGSDEMIKFEKRFLKSPYFIEKYERFEGEKYEFSTNSGGILSVIRCLGSYGYERGEYEIAYIKEDGTVCEPLGYLSVDDVLTIVDYENGKEVENKELINCWEKKKWGNGRDES
ncbi:hypothetical protein C7J88_09605 [Staphylococcus muscae]|uniref:Uncharacterized protein n=1 Tax=Staphylococcus muscae TaxID=1294 RepID=A0A240BXY0_9STAP|nr:hypothetical protein [Staphylococcus muscae]AVQ34404.1 hypothetical protein C7J88_09605 [Staphylococcus muscae]PNZ01008.1 hypothetical protein CD131_09640 [Staphylococcus muscae]GGA93356.1 hypothetical protein GCM10007183_16940 [Staphylococcus muscae]SNW00647.1 Uncharacterised protein [Staphylococcus muscae]